MGVKKVPKTKLELAREIEVQQRKKFVDALEKLEKTHGYKMIGMIEYKHNGIYPSVGLEKVDPEKEEKPKEKKA